MTITLHGLVIYLFDSFPFKIFLKVQMYDATLLFLLYQCTVIKAVTRRMLHGFHHVIVLCYGRSQMEVKAGVNVDWDVPFMIRPRRVDE